MMLKLKLSEAQLAALDLLDESEDGIEPIGIKVLGVRGVTLNKLEDYGFIRFLPHGTPPRWILTESGREYLSRHP